MIGDRIRIAAIMPTARAAGGQPASPASAQSDRARRVRYDEIILPQDQVLPASLPPASILVPLFKSMMARLGIGGGRAAVALGCPRMVLRHFVGPDDHVRAELQQASVRSMGYVRFGLGDRVVEEHIHRMEDKRLHALLGVSASGTIDPITQALEQVGLRVKAIEPGLVALARIGSLTGPMNGDISLLVLVDADGADIGVVWNGHVLFGRRPVRSGGLDPDSPASLPATGLARELEKTARHCVRAFGAGEELRHVILSGPDDLVGPYVESLVEKKDFDVHVLKMNGVASETLSVPDADLEAGDPHVVALGAAVGLISECHNVIGPNLASEPEVRHRSPLKPFLRVLFWPTLIAVAIWAGISLFEDHLQSRLDKNRIEVEHASPVETTYKQLQMELIHLDRLAERLDKLTRMFRNRQWSGLLHTIRICVRDRLWLSSVQITDQGHITIQGTAYVETLIYQFSKDLEGAPLFENVTITTTTSTQRGSTMVTEFSLECTVTSSLGTHNESDL